MAKTRPTSTSTNRVFVNCICAPCSCTSSCCSLGLRSFSESTVLVSAMVARQCVKIRGIEVDNQRLNTPSPTLYLLTSLTRRVNSCICVPNNERTLGRTSGVPRRISVVLVQTPLLSGEQSRYLLRGMPVPILGQVIYRGGPFGADFAGRVGLSHKRGLLDGLLACSTTRCLMPNLGRVQGMA
jgi:hypothetical protein